MTKRDLKKARLSVSVSEGQKSELQAIADENDISLARVIQEAVKEFLGRHRDRRLSIFDRRKPPKKG
jgi:predicted transcriptional regulator